jgi:hypothetical protein
MKTKKFQFKTRYWEPETVEDIPTEDLKRALAQKVPQLSNWFRPLLNHAADQHPNIIAIKEELDVAKAKYAALPIHPTYGEPHCEEGYMLKIATIPRLTRRLGGLRKGERRRILADNERSKAVLIEEVARRRLLGVPCTKLNQ